MKSLSIILFSFLFSVAAFSQTRSSVTTIRDLDWMAGCWEQKDAAKGVYFSEQWMKPAGTSILGMGRTVKDGKTATFEFMRIEQNTDGIFFIAQPKENKEETAFKLKNSTLNEVVFENLGHDFPQRVIYEHGGTKLIGRIEGTESGKTLAFDFPMTKVRCA
ncbi:MAG: DUF6265 family protein [Acidobacteriota bacterium]